MPAASGGVWMYWLWPPGLFETASSWSPGGGMTARSCEPGVASVVELGVTEGKVSLTPGRSWLGVPCSCVPAGPNSSRS